MKVFIAGSGKLAKALLASDLSIPSAEVVKWETKYKLLNDKAIVVHAGSGRQLNECMEFCSRTKSVLIELSTGLGTEKLFPEFPLIVCPNISVLVLKALNMLRKNGKQFENCTISILESHQSSKKSEPGTAFAFADALKFPRENIVSIRNPDIQLHQLRIPADYLEKHAYHKIVIRDGDDEITINATVVGHTTYANGLAWIVTVILNNPLENRKYSIFELIDKE